MARPKKIRKVGCLGDRRGFKPVGRPVSELETITLALDELEALRLADLEGLYQEAAADHMGVSRPTFARILRRAREKLVRALIDEHLLLIGKGPVVTKIPDSIPCPVHGPGGRLGRGCRCRRSGT